MIWCIRAAEAYGDAAGRARDCRPVGDDDRDDQDLQHRGRHIGNVIIPDPALRAAFGARMMALGISPNRFGLFMATAAYSPEGAAWVDALMAYLDENRRLFDAGVNAIPGLKSMPLEATYLAWVDFSGTGMSASGVHRAGGKGGADCREPRAEFWRGWRDLLRFNIATPRARVREAVARLKAAFSDLQ